MDRLHTCCFTGGRPEHVGFDQADPCTMGALRRDLAQAIRRAAANGYTDFLCGMSRGFDLWAGEAVLALADELDLRLHAAIPFRRQTNGWPVADLTLYENVLRGCADVFVLAEEYRHGVYHERNCFMVDNSSLVIAWHVGRQGGGTDFTCRYARKCSVPVVNLANPQLCLL